LFHEFNTVDRNIALYMQDVGFQPWSSTYPF
jgi:hypothetical protein